ncbi:hypothetical protein ABS648_07490 [Pseudomonas solani]|jgi:hypothetical protein|uniref:Uncharacterized protein n=1 Tax=Pseudomonas solani TaxID=2731552 RepID=A0AAU7Y683_9PSED|nr:hypothetical protein L682_08065 [Pseudomonas alcaligenes OT 69]MDN4148631.1 hypothetical protein [Pseudomonas tohonis]
MDSESLHILLVVTAAVGAHLAVRWYLIHGLAPDEEPDDKDDWLA